MADYEVRIDRKKCIGAGFCAKLTPEVYSLDDGKKVVLREGVKTGEDAMSLGIGEKSLSANIMAAKVCPSYAIDVIDKKTGKSVLDIDPSKSLPVRMIDAHYDSMKEWVMDPNGFFTIKPFPDEGVIRVRYYNAKHQLAALVEGRNAEEIYVTICREGLVSVPSHAAYLGSELQKAEIAMKKNLPYVQDDPLNV